MGDQIAEHPKSDSRARERSRSWWLILETSFGMAVSLGSSLAVDLVRLRDPLFVGVLAGSTAILAAMTFAVAGFNKRNAPRLHLRESVRTAYLSALSRSGLPLVGASND
jgi:hypothetical protein